MLDRIHWLGHAAFRLAAHAVIYLDPFQIAPGPVADVILITHRHRDHCSPEDIAKVSGPATQLLAPADCLDVLPSSARAIAPGETVALPGVEVSAVPAYNIDKPNHPRSNGWVGYVVSVDGTRIYHAGDTDLIPEMRTIRADIALLPIGGTYTMTAEEAVDAVRLLRPSAVIPMHYGPLVGTAEDAERFRRLAGAVAVVRHVRA